MIKVVLKIHDFDELSFVAKVFKLQAGLFLSPLRSPYSENTVFHLRVGSFSEAKFDLKPYLSRYLKGFKSENMRRCDSPLTILNCRYFFVVF